MPASFYGWYDYAYPLDVFRSEEIFVVIAVAMQSAGELTCVTIKRYTLHSQQSAVRTCDSRNWTVTVNDTAELRHPWCRAKECCLHRGIPKPNCCASCYGTLSSSLSSTSFFTSLVAIAISGLAHRADVLCQLLPSCMRYKHWDSEPDLDTDACPRFTVFSFDGLIPSSKGCYYITKRLTL